MAFENEKLARGIRTVLQANLADYLDTVEAEWASIEAITLPDPVSWMVVASSVILELYGDDFPIVVIMAPNRTPADQEQIANIFVDFFVFSDDSIDTVGWMAYRYADALCRVVDAKAQTVEGWQISDQPIGVDMSEVIRHPTTMHADMQDSDDYGYLMGARLTAVYSTEQLTV